MHGKMQVSSCQQNVLPRCLAAGGKCSEPAWGQCSEQNKWWWVLQEQFHGHYGCEITAPADVTATLEVVRV